MSDHPTDNLIRARYGGDTIGTDGDGRTLFGHFSVFNSWTKIDSHYEGTFLERVVPGAFRDAFANPKNLRVLYEHGADPDIGTKPIAVPTEMREDDQGAYYEAELFDAPYATQLLPALRAGQLGASFRFSVLDEDWTTPTRATPHNPEKLPERSIKRVQLYEFGPVTWGAYPDATTGVRSGTDSFIDRLLNDPRFVARFTERAGLSVVERVLSDLSDTPSEPATQPDPQRPTALTTPSRLDTLRTADLDRIAAVVSKL